MKLFISVVAGKVIVWCISYSACVVYIKTIISFSICELVYFTSTSVNNCLTIMIFCQGKFPVFFRGQFQFLREFVVEESGCEVRFVSMHS